MEKSALFPLYAEVDLRLVTAAKRVFDAGGHYARPDVFTLTLTFNRKPDRNLDFRD